MNPEEYTALERIERDHWFYAGKREIVLWWLKRTAKLQPESLLVDCGAGTACFAAEVSKLCKVVAVDDHRESLEMAAKRLRPDQIREGSCTHLPIDDSVADAVTALDVIEHIADDEAAVKEMARVLKPGGVLLVTVPAFAALWSDWDVSLHHHRRYRHFTLLPLIENAGLTLLHWNYINVLAFPAILAIRKLRVSLARNADGQRAEERIPPGPINKALQAAFVRPACQTRWRFPFGVGLLAIARRGTSPEG